MSVFINRHQCFRGASYRFHLQYSTDQAGLVVTLETCIWEVVGLNLCQDTGHPDWGFPCYFSVLPLTYQDRALIRFWLFPSKSFQMCYSSFPYLTPYNLDTDSIIHTHTKRQSRYHTTVNLCAGMMIGILNVIHIFIPNLFFFSLL
jgi:hypothetical protein